MIVDQNSVVKNGNRYLDGTTVHLDRLMGIRQCLVQLRIQSLAAGLEWSAHFMEAAILEIDTVLALGDQAQAKVQAQVHD